MKNVILDVDTGIDDALAISYAVHSPELNILGITTTFGNTTVEEASRNTLQLLSILDAKDIPVYQGVEETFAGHIPAEKTTWIHGENGIGEAVLPSTDKQVENIRAHEFLIQAVHQHPHDITILTTANQGNLAKAIQQDNEVINLVKEVIHMGGAVTVPGNVTPYAEANIYHDPEAAQFIFQSGVPITLVGLDVTLKTLLKRSVLDDWRKKNTPLPLFLADMCEFYMGAYAKNQPELDGCALHDPLTVGVAIDSSYVTTKMMTVHVITEGEEKGRTVGTENENGNVEVCVDVDTDRFVAHFLDRVCF